MKKIFILFYFFSCMSFAGIAVNKISEVKQGDQTKLIVAFEGNFRENPDIDFSKIREKKVFFTIPKANISDSLVKHIKNQDSVLITENKNDVEIEVSLARYYNGINNQISLSVLSDKIIASLPSIERKSVPVKKVIEKKEEVKKRKVYIEEENSLVSKNNREIDFTPISKQDNREKKSVDQNLDYLVNDFVKKEVVKKENKNLSRDLLEDSVSTKQGASEKTKVETASTVSLGKEDKPFSYSSYIFKVLGVLIGIIALFLLSVNFFRKKVLNKSKIGFLNNSKIVEVIATTYVGPKKNLLLVKVHEQFLLLSNTENTINFLTEVKDPAGLLRQGEEEVTGSNFQNDLTINSEKDLEGIVKLKDENKIYESQPVNYRSASFSDHLKKRVKRLKPLQNQS